MLSCEHADFRIPEADRSFFASREAQLALRSHRGWDVGSHLLARHLASELGAPLHVQTISRLLVDCNRSEGHPRLWSEFSRRIPVSRREEILSSVWDPHLEAIRSEVEVQARTAPVLHIGVHSFTPLWKGRRRTTDIGVLCDPSRHPESAAATTFVRALRADSGLAGWTVHRNRPYRGWTDGLTRTLRRRFPPERYLGLELEVSSIRIEHGIEPALARALVAAIQSLCDESGAPSGPPTGSIRV